MNNWSENLKDSIEKEEFFDRFYESIYPNLSKVERADLETDKRGIDKILHFFNGDKVTVQEKFRDADYNDFLIEIYHEYSNGNKKDGWARKITADIMYYYVPNKIYEIDLRQLKEWGMSNKDYVKELKYKRAYNPQGNYWTYNKAVPWERLEFVKCYKMQ